MRGIIRFSAICALLLFEMPVQAQLLQRQPGKVEFSNGQNKITLHLNTGLVDYAFTNGIRMENTAAYCTDVDSGELLSAGYSKHTFKVSAINDQFGSGRELTIVHADARHKISLIQHIRLYNSSGQILVNVTAQDVAGRQVETRDISPLAILPRFNGIVHIPGNEPRILDVPFDNDNWVSLLERGWPDKSHPASEGISYEFTAVYDRKTMEGIFIGSVNHDFWKTGLSYHTGREMGTIDSLNIFGGAATPDQPGQPAAYGGHDGTHDLVAHGTMIGRSVRSADIFICAGKDINELSRAYGAANVKINGSLRWTGYAPVYWNSFGVEDVLGSHGIMMPAGVRQISDTIRSLENFNGYGKPVLSIDSYDQKIYSTEALRELGRYAKKNGQQMGFYFIPFALWTWKDRYEGKKLQGTDYLISDVLLRDNNHQPILYKDGEFCSYALDPTHPAIRQLIISQLEKAKAIHAKFLKIDFLSAGSLESSVRYDPSVRSGMQAYNKGMKMLKHLVDSVMGPHIFITQAISPMFPSQYAHTRFVSTDVYSHFRDDQPGFPHYGSTEASLATGSHMGWVQGTLWPFTNLDVCVMKNFQHNPDLTEREIKVRLYALMVMGSILGDGSDLRNPVAAGRARYFLNNKALCTFFSHPRAFTPIQFADGDSPDQQLSFYLPGDTTMLALFNFNKERPFEQYISRAALHLNATSGYILKDFLTGKEFGQLKSGQAAIIVHADPADALLLTVSPTLKRAPF